MQNHDVVEVEEKCDFLALPQSGHVDGLQPRNLIQKFYPLEGVPATEFGTCAAQLQHVCQHLLHELVRRQGGVAGADRGGVKYDPAVVKYPLFVELPAGRLGEIRVSPGLCEARWEHWEDLGCLVERVVEGGGEDLLAPACDECFYPLVQLDVPPHHDVVHAGKGLDLEEGEAVQGNVMKVHRLHGHHRRHLQPQRRPPPCSRGVARAVLFAVEAGLLLRQNEVELDPVAARGSHRHTPRPRVHLRIPLRTAQVQYRGVAIQELQVCRRDLIQKGHVFCVVGVCGVCPQHSRRLDDLPAPLLQATKAAVLVHAGDREEWQHPSYLGERPQAGGEGV
mmetsp:Transcript_11217/g.24938  ORF Transcript_11217/g.24938 Transcript_11217/m.24938 type:complete len:336 (+) Transcript_11217:823-1830(+)